MRCEPIILTGFPPADAAFGSAPPFPRTMPTPGDRDLLIAWSLLPFLTPNRTRLLRGSFEPVETACSASPSLIQKLLGVTADQAREILTPFGGGRRTVVRTLRDQTVTLADTAYPALLREIVDPPLALHFRGDLTLLARSAVSVVGSRRATPYGINAATHLTERLAAAGLAIVSGAARGIDAAAHLAALGCGAATVAVLGTGIDVVYPRSNSGLFRRLERDALLVTEFPPSTPPRRENFPIRNRVISGLSLGTLLVEATSRSGSLITARTAAEQGREVFAVPGPIFSAGSEGTHRLIQYGAKLVHSVEDVLEELPGGFQAAAAGPERLPPEPLREVLSAFRREEGVHVDAAAAQLGRAPASLSHELLQLELGGWLRALPGSRYVRTS